VNAFLYRYVTSQDYDRWLAAATFFVTGAPDVRSIVTLHPKLTDCHIGMANGTEASQPTTQYVLHE
jgi:hypothetical protein